MQEAARLVIVGAGIVGTSVAYHLAQLGWRDIVVVDQGPLFATGGSTSHAPGLVFQTNASKMMTEFAKYSVKLYGNLSSEALPSWYGVGGIEVAYTPERWQDLKRKHGIASSYNLESHLLSPREVKAQIPILEDGVIHGGFYVPTDGDARAVNVVTAMAAACGDAVSFYGHTKVTDIEVAKARVRGVVTTNGRIVTDMILLCTNIWGPVLAKKLGVTVPLMAVEHQYLITEPIAELASDKGSFIKHPILRHQDFSMYFRQHGDAYGIGSYRHEPLLVSPWKIGEDAMRPFTPQHFEIAQQATDTLLPPLRGKKFTTRFNGMFAFTIDGMPVMGPVLDVEGFWLALGVWVTHGGGVGRAMAHWLDSGATPIDLREADANRFHAHVLSKKYIQLRCAQQYREVYDIIHPLQQMETPRDLRLSPFHTRLVEQGGVFFEAAGWEVAQWYNANEMLLEKYGDAVPDRSGWEARYWSCVQGAEHLATREGVAMYNISAFTKIEVSGGGALAYLEWLSANRVDRPVGKVVYTAWLNEAGGIKSDLTITRLGADRFWVLTGGGMGMRDLAWLRQHAPERGVVIRDITSSYCTLGLWGPKARAVLQSVCEEDVSDAAFPYFTAKRLTIEMVPVLALRVSYVGELGWELYAPTEQGLHLWDVLWQAGRPQGMIMGGGGAFDSLRLEKGYRLWGADIYTEHNPYEAGLGWAVRLNHGDFLGREALLRIKAHGIRRQLCCLTFDDPEGMALGKEPILVNGRPWGYVTSANYGYSVGQFILYGYLPLDYAAVGTKVAVEYFGRRYGATVMADPLYDPEMRKLKG